MQGRPDGACERPLESPMRTPLSKSYAVHNCLPICLSCTEIASNSHKGNYDHMTAANSNATIRVEFICARDCRDEILITHIKSRSGHEHPNIINYYYG